MVYSTTQRKKGGKPYSRPYPLPYGLRYPYRNLKSENSQDYAQKPERDCTFMNSVSEGEGKSGLNIYVL